MSTLTDTRLFIDEMIDELKKVTWPDWPQLKNATLVILLFVVLVAGIIWLMDMGVRVLIDGILNAFAL